MADEATSDAVEASEPQEPARTSTVSTPSTDSRATPAMPLLQAHGARVAVDDVVAIQDLTVSTVGRRVVLAGDAQALVATITAVPLGMRHGASLLARDSDTDDMPLGEARLVGGMLKVNGHDMAAGHPRVDLGVALLDPPLPLTWTAEDYVAWSARLGGASARAVRDMAASALMHVGLTNTRKRLLQAYTLPERRVVMLAQALVLNPRVLVLEDPLTGLEAGAAGFVLSAMARATEGRGTLIALTRLDMTGPAAMLLRRSSYVVVLKSGELTFEGSLAELADSSRVYTLTVSSNAEALRAELEGMSMTLLGGPRRFSLVLPEYTTTQDIVTAAARVRAAVVEMIPLF